MIGSRFHPEAERELSEVALWYEERRPQLGDRFAVEVDRVLGHVRAAPQGGTRWRQGPARTWRLRRFPFVVAYVVESDEVVIVAIAHTKRRPGYWQSRIA